MRLEQAAPLEEEEWERLPLIPRGTHSSELPERIVLREILRHYSEFREYVAQGNNPVLEHTYLVPVTGVSERCAKNWRSDKQHEALKMRCVHCNSAMRRVTVSFNFWDLHLGFKKLSPRKQEALFWNILQDQKQKDVAKIMGITTVTVGRYAQLALNALIEEHVVKITDE